VEEILKTRLSANQVGDDDATVVFRWPRSGVLRIGHNPRPTTAELSKNQDAIRFAVALYSKYPWFVSSGRASRGRTLECFEALDGGRKHLPNSTS
jgi:hypothetical protein